MHEKIKKIIENKAFKALALSLIIGGSLSGGYILGFENAKGLPATHKYYPSNKILATVGPTKIKTNVLKKQMEMYFASQPQKEFTDEEIQEKELTYIDYIVTRESLKQKALKDGLTVDDEMVQSYYDDLCDRLETLYNLTAEEVIKKYDLDENYIKECVKEELLGNAYLDSISKISDEEATKYYNENPLEFIECEASHILIKTIDDDYNTLPEEKLVDAEKRANDILKRVLNGEDFATLAKDKSEDASAIDGGDLGYFKKGEMVEEFEEAVFSLKTGDVTQSLVKTQFGYHIIKKTGERETSLEDAIASIKDKLAYNKKYDTMKDILDSPDIKIEYGN